MKPIPDTPETPKDCHLCPPGTRHENPHFHNAFFPDGAETQETRQFTKVEMLGMADLLDNEGQLGGDMLRFAANALPLSQSGNETGSEFDQLQAQKAAMLLRQGICSAKTPCRILTTESETWCAPCRHREGMDREGIEALMGEPLAPSSSPREPQKDETMEKHWRDEQIVFTAGWDAAKRDEDAADDEDIADAPDVAFLDWKRNDLREPREPHAALIAEITEEIARGEADIEATKGLMSRFTHGPRHWQFEWRDQIIRTQNHLALLRRCLLALKGA